MRKDVRTTSAIRWVPLALFSSTLLHASTPTDKSAWQQFVHCRTITCMAFEGTVCWAGTGECGLVRLDTRTGEMSTFTNLNSPLPSNSVAALTIGSDGALWIGTSEGLARYTTDWRLFLRPSAPFLSNDITALAAGDSGTVWVGCGYGGVFRYRDSTWTALTTMNPGFPLAIICSPTKSLAVDSSKNLWISAGSMRDAVDPIRFDGASWHSYGYIPASGIVPAAGAVWMVTITGELGAGSAGLERFGLDGSELKDQGFTACGFTNGTVLCGDGSSLCLSNGKDLAVYADGVWQCTTSPALGTNRTITSLAFDSSRALWAGCANADAGPEICGPGGWIGHSLQGGTAPFTEVTRIYPDGRGNAWIPYGFQTVGVDPDGNWWFDSTLESSVVTQGGDEKRGRDGNFWSVAGNTLRRRDPSGNVTVYGSENFTFLSGGYYVGGFDVDNMGKAWLTSDSSCSGRIVNLDLATLSVVRVIDPPAGVRPDDITAAPDGSCWCVLTGCEGYRGIGMWTTGANLQSFDAANSPVPPYVSNIIAGADSSVWIGGSWLVRYKAGVWTLFDTSSAKLPGPYCTPLAADRSGRVWTTAGCRESRLTVGGMPNFALTTSVHRYSIGLACFDGANWELYNTSNSGIPSNSINCVATDDSGTLWVGTDLGLGILRADRTSSLRAPRAGRSGEYSGRLSVTLTQRGSVRLVLSEPAVVRVETFDIGGRYLDRQPLSRRTAGAYVIAIDKFAGKRSPLPHSLYVVKISADFTGASEHRSVMVVGK